MIPINKNSADPFYRYKMPPLNVIREGKQGNPRTIILNFVNVCEYLKRSPVLIKQYFIYQLSVQIKRKRDQLVINGEVAAEILQDILYQCINLLLLCGQCCNPETGIRLNEQRKKEIVQQGSSSLKCCKNLNGQNLDGQSKNLNEESNKECNDSSEEDESDLVLECYACGAVTAIRSNHKIVGFILKNRDCVEEQTYYKEINGAGTTMVRTMATTGLGVTGRSSTSGASNGYSTIPVNNESVNDAPSKTIHNFRNIIEQAFEKNHFLILNNLEEPLKIKENRLKFFEILEQYSVQNENVQNIGRVFEVLKKFLVNSEFDYFRKRSKVVQKKESVRIRNILSNYVDYKDN